MYERLIINNNAAFVSRMNINATLIVQVINFFIAYFLFRFILLKPAYTIIVEEQETKALLEQLISDDKRLIAKREQELQEQWRENYVFFKKNLPEPLDHVALFKGTAPKIKLPSLDQTGLVEVKDNLVSLIVKAIVEDTP